MPLYYFNVYDGRDVFDDVGTDLTGSRQVRDHMMTVAQAWIEQEDNQATHWQLEARDEDGNIVGSMRFGVKPDSENS